MANVYQRAAKQRKIIYLASIGVLLLLSLVVRGTFFRIDRKSADEVQGSPMLALTLDGRANVHELTELQQGDKELGGAAIQLLLTGSRGFAVSALWLNAIDKQKKHEWNELDISVNSITKLQPHFTAPWLFQSWNLTYNVSVEMDRLNDMYFYIARGISVIAEGESLNRNNPDLRYNAGFYFQNKFGVSDKVTTLRCLYQLSCIPDEDRDPDRLVTVNSDGTRTVNLAAFEEFCRAHPQLIRRLKETRISSDGSDERSQPLASSPAAVVSFLRMNRKIPSRYRPATRELHRDRLKQFPVLPDIRNPNLPIPTRSELDFESDLADHDQDAFQAARAWYALANCALPPPSEVPSADGSFNPDPLKYRIPKRPATIIFRQGPPRAQTYIADRLTKEGWFNAQPWEIDNLIDLDRVWIPKTEDGKPVSVRLTTQMSAQQAWQVAFRRWQDHGTANGLRMDAARLQTYVSRSEEYCRMHPGKLVGDMPGPLTPEERQEDSLFSLFEAQTVVNAWAANRNMTQFERFELESAAMQTDQAMLARLRFLQAEKTVREAAQYSDAIRLYNEGFDAWKQVLVSHQDCRARRGNEAAIYAQRCQDFRDIDLYQEDMYERNMRQVKLMQDVHQRKLREATPWLHDLVFHIGASTSGNPFQFACDLNVLANDAERVREKKDDPVRIETRAPQLKGIPSLALPGPLDGLAPDGTPWIKPDVQFRIKQKLGLIKQAPPSAPPEIPGGEAPPRGAGMP